MDYPPPPPPPPAHLQLVSRESNSQQHPGYHLRSLGCPSSTTTGDPDVCGEVETGKIESDVSDDEAYQYVEVLRVYHLIDCQQYMTELKKSCLCPTCRSPLTLSEDLTGRRGLVSRLMTVCTNAECTYQIIMSTPQESKTLNARSVLAMRSIGRG